MTYEPPDVPLEKNTYYTQEFINKQPLPEIRRFEPPRENFRKSSAKFDGRTTYKDHHKHWVGQKQVPFGELPSFAGNLLFNRPLALKIHVLQVSISMDITTELLH